jgi:hypothetical protein
MTVAKTKSGYVYLLKSESEEGVYKVGCTTLHPNQRAKKVNYEYKRKENFDFRFSVIAYEKVKSPYSIENHLKHKLVQSGFCLMSEAFHISMCELEEDELLKRFYALIKEAISKCGSV